MRPAEVETPDHRIGDQPRFDVWAHTSSLVVCLNSLTESTTINISTFKHPSKERDLTDDDVVLRDEALLERLGLGVHHHLPARKTLADVVVSVSLHLEAAYTTGTIRRERTGGERKTGSTMCDIKSGCKKYKPCCRNEADFFHCHPEFRSNSGAT